MSRFVCPEGCPQDRLSWLCPQDQDSSEFHLVNPVPAPVLSCPLRHAQAPVPSFPSIGGDSGTAGTGQLPKEERMKITYYCGPVVFAEAPEHVGKHRAKEGQ